MYQDQKILALIGARGNSAGLKNKHLLDFLGYPLIYWTIRAARKSRCLDEVVVSTDSRRIADISKHYGATLPFMRPAHLAKPDASTASMVCHCLSWLKRKKLLSYDYVVLLQPTSPLRTEKHIDQAIRFYFKTRKTPQDTLVSVKKVSEKMAWVLKLTPASYLKFCLSKTVKPRQKNRSLFLPNGAIYISPIRSFKKNGFYSQRTLAYVMSEEESMDIDTLSDFSAALVAKKKQLSLKLR